MTNRLVIAAVALGAAGYILAPLLVAFVYLPAIDAAQRLVFPRSTPCT